MNNVAHYQQKNCSFYGLKIAIMKIAAPNIENVDNLCITLRVTLVLLIS